MVRRNDAAATDKETKMLKDRYRLIGSEEAPVICDFCKRKHVQRYWAVEDTVTGEILRCGSSCIRRALQVTTKEFNSEVRESQRRVHIRYCDLSRDLEKKAEAARVAWRQSVGKVVGFPPEGSEADILTKRCARLQRRRWKEVRRFEAL